MGYVFAAPPQAVVPVDGTSDLFPVHRIYCVGRNYAEHAKEMGFSERDAPFFFAKPADAVLPVPFGTTGEFPYASETANLHHEIELVVAIGKSGTAAGAAKYIYGYAVGLDMTRRDLQIALRDKGRPWDVAKGFDYSAPISPIKTITATGEILSAQIWLNVNGVRRQASTTAKLIWSVNEVIEHLSKFFELRPGDLIYTGTPEGVGAVQRGDELDGGIEKIGALKVKVV